MDIHNIKERFKLIDSTEDIPGAFALSKELVNEPSKEAEETHFYCVLEATSNIVLQVFANSFAKRADSSDFLDQLLLDSEQPDRAKGIALQMLGKNRDSKALKHALKAIETGNYDYQYRGIIVLGWVGLESELNTLAEVLGNNPNPKLRGYAATAMRQIYIRHPHTDQTIRDFLEKALRLEEDEGAIAHILIVLQEVTVCNTNLKENLQNGKIEGDVKQAKTKMLTCLDNA